MRHDNNERNKLGMTRAKTKKEKGEQKRKILRVK